MTEEHAGRRITIPGKGQQSVNGPLGRDLKNSGLLSPVTWQESKSTAKREPSPGRNNQGIFQECGLVTNLAKSKW